MRLSEMDVRKDARKNMEGHYKKSNFRRIKRPFGLGGV